MDINNSIRQIATNTLRDTGIVCHDSTIAYLQYLLRPYVEAINLTKDINKLPNWIHAAFPEYLAKDIDDHISNSRVKAGKGEVFVGIEYAIIEYIVSDIITLANHLVMDYHDHIIIPYDIQRVIEFDNEYRIVFQIYSTGQLSKLPIGVEVIPGNKFTHLVSEEFFAGLLLFSAEMKIDFHVTMFDVPFSSDYMGNGNNRFTNRKGDTYNILIAGITYYFNWIDFLQGFSTGSLWTGKDYHIWQHLTRYNPETDKDEEITF